MTSTTNTLIALATTVSAFAFSAPSQAVMTPQTSYMKLALVDVCLAAKSNKLHKLNKTKKAHRLNSKTIALKVSCNGQDIIAFAQSHGAHKTAGHLEKSIGSVSISEIATVKRVNVNVEG